MIEVTRTSSYRPTWEAQDRPAPTIMSSGDVRARNIGLRRKAQAPGLDNGPLQGNNLDKMGAFYRGFVTELQK